MKSKLIMLSLLVIILFTSCNSAIDVKVTESDVWKSIVNKEWSAGLQGFYFHEEDEVAYCTFMIYGSGVRVARHYKAVVNINDEGNILMSLPEHISSPEYEKNERLDLKQKVLSYENKAIIFESTKFEVHDGINNYEYILPDDNSIILDETRSLIEPTGEVIEERILCPDGFKRREEKEDTFAYYLRNSLLKPHDAEVSLFDGRIKYNQSIHVAVLDLDVGDRDLQQCADATMRLWAEYLRSINQSDNIHFEFTNGFLVEYSKWMQGYRTRVDGNDVSWIKSKEASNSDETFMSYMQVIFTYAGTLSLSNELDKVDIENMEIGDVFVQGGSPGHAVIVVDMARNNDTGEQLYLLAQSYMPAQDIHILTNPNNELLSPWYVLDDRDNIKTPEWNFNKSDLKRYN